MQYINIFPENQEANKLLCYQTLQENAQLNLTNILYSISTKLEDGLSFVLKVSFPVFINEKATCILKSELFVFCMPKFVASLLYKSQEFTIAISIR